MESFQPGSSSPAAKPQSYMEEVGSEISHDEKNLWGRIADYRKKKKNYRNLLSNLLADLVFILERVRRMLVSGPQIC